jgi:hypothetical protein
MNQNNNFQEKIINELTQRVKRKNFHGNIYFFLNDWFYGISWIISIAAPFAVAMILYVPDMQESIGFAMLLITGIGTSMQLVRSVFRLKERADYVNDQKREAEKLLNKILANSIKPEEIVEEFDRLLRTDKNEPAAS